MTIKLEKEHKKEIDILNKKIAKLDYFKDDEIDETIEHTLDKCSECGGSLNVKETNIVKSKLKELEIIFITCKCNNFIND